MTTPTAAATAPEDSHNLERDARRFGDTIFRGLSTVSGLTIFLILFLVAAFLLLQSLDAFRLPADQLEYGNTWMYVAPYAFGTVWAATLAMIFAVPVAIGIALFLTHYAPKRVSQVFGYIIDLLAAVPSIIFGLWGLQVFSHAVQPLYKWLNKTLWRKEELSGDGPLVGLANFYLRHSPFGGQVSATGRTVLTAALVLAVMVLPIITALSREVFRQTPRLHEEASLALGATRWEMIRQSVLPYGASGVVSACMLGLGRALGETMAVAMVLSPSNRIHIHVLSSSNPNTIASNIALNFGEAYGTARSQLIATGLVLFAITLIVNMTARAILSRRKQFSGAN